MQGLYEVIAPLAALDLEQERLERTRDRAILARDQAIAGQRALEEQLARATAALEVHAEAQRALRRQLDRAQRSIDAARRALDYGGGGAEASIRQLDQNLALLDEHETHLLEGLEEEERLQAELAAARRALAEATEAVASARVPSAVLDAISAADAQRQTLLGHLSREYREHYLHLRPKGAFAKVLGAACGRCNSTITPQLLNELRKGELKSCRSCHRWLVVAEG
ncbi:MAG: hypothetical protein JXX28_03145 [Deltaproteobacteria bacterium]|nr:hypothetical protein [Deltaproteobacteria bacterium]